eukprot:12763526-Alexandrium_andersonii.AAC.1
MKSARTATRRRLSRPRPPLALSSSAPAQQLGKWAQALQAKSALVLLAARIQQRICAAGSSDESSRGGQQIARRLP